MKFTDVQKIKILAFDTSCDETSVAVLQGRRVLSSVISSQVELHKKWGGVVPKVARRAHEENIESTYKEALTRAKTSIEEIDAIAVTYGPGLAIDLEIGIIFAKELALKYNKKLLPVNHMEGHLLSSLLLNSKGRGKFEKPIESAFPILGVLASGKHTELIYAKSPGKYIKLGKTLDDAAGECFDKVGRMLNFGYPGGPVITEFAKKSTGKYKFDLPIPMEKSGDLNFSYSGLKTACLYKVNKLREEGLKDSDWVYDFCREFVDVVIKSISIKVEKALPENPDIKTILTGGGVYNNEKIIRDLQKVAKNNNKGFLFPEKRFRGDNAAMIALAGLRMYKDSEYISDKTEIQKLDRVPRLELGN